MNRKRIFSFALCFSLLVLFSCTDTTIEGAATTTSGFAISKISSTNATINTGSCTSSGKSGTNFTVQIDYQGTEVITSIKLTYKFFTGTTAGTSTGPITLTSGSDYVVTGAGSGGAFRSASGTSNVKVYSCVSFGTTTSLQYDYTITTTTSPLKTYPTTITITKPTGAN